MHSLLFVPAKEKMLSKIPSFTADCYIVDLEDSIEEGEKLRALEAAIHFFKQQLIDTAQIIVRVNKTNAENEIAALLPYGVGYMLPKVEKSSDYSFMRNYAVNRTAVALIESPLGLMNIKDIVSESYITAIAFGAEDYTAGVGKQNFPSLLIYEKSRLVMYARAYNKQVYDTPSFEIADQELFEQDVINSKNLGFDGKMAINPKHLDYINRTWDDASIEAIKRIIDKYDSEGKAVNVIDGRVYEKMHIARMRKILKEQGEG